MKRFLSLLLVLIFAFGMVSCQGTESGKENLDSGSNVATNATDPTNDSTDPTTEPTTEEAHYPVTIENCEHTWTYDKAPETIFTLDQNAATTLVALGLGDRIISTRVHSVEIEDVDERYRDEVAKIPHMDIPEGMSLSFEYLLSISPDMIYMDSYYFNIPDFGTAKDYDDNGIKILCTEGTFVPHPTIQNTMNDIRNLGKIFDREERAEEIIQEINDRLAKVKEKIAGKEKVRVLIFDTISEDGAIVAGGAGLAHALVEEAGGENVLAYIEKQFATISWEEVIASDPDFIIVDDYDYGDGGNADLTIENLKKMEELSEMRAIKENKFIKIKLGYIFSGIHNIDAIEIFADGFFGEDE